ncbi:hypothetical protein [Hymenobacter coccineus]|uniref:hypothetical protein n=1 Tax=Hymenobacter coccineus TaxID=1908235 RepID=UPI00130100E1|nr:hypothetical protein [Hymenobacter coccineus]
MLEDCARDLLALDQVLARLDGRMHHVRYCSWATHPFTDGQLTDLLTCPPVT